MPSSFKTSSNCGSSGPFFVRDMSRAISMLSRAVKRRQQIVFLENEPNGGFAQLGALGVRHPEQIAAGDLNGPGGRRRQPAHDVKQSRFARTRRPDDGYKFARLNVQIHAAQRMHIHFAGMIGFSQRREWK
jgi:hypothetical protein